MHLSKLTGQHTAKPVFKNESTTKFELDQREYKEISRHMTMTMTLYNRRANVNSCLVVTSQPCRSEGEEASERGVRSAQTLKFGNVIALKHPVCYRRCQSRIQRKKGD